mmetsp:Transcript_16253/g.34482  ORF Transcript_16253/g.34482 Transcript_16253/m.34482 type:complete len:80 (-) Transcript_16253:8-247(-)
MPGSALAPLLPLIAASVAGFPATEAICEQLEDNCMPATAWELGRVVVDVQLQYSDVRGGSYLEAGEAGAGGGADGAVGA